MKASWRWIIYRDSPRSDNPATADCHLAECFKVFSQSGRTFRDYHLLVEQIFATIDPVTERASKTRDLGKQAIKRLGEPEDITGAILFLTSDDDFSGLDTVSLSSFFLDP